MRYGKHTLLTLPNELLEHILLLGTVSDVAVCGQTCRKLHSVVAGSLRLEYKIECYIARVLDGGSRHSAVCIRDRLEGVRQSRRAWRTMRPTGESCIAPTDGAMEIFGSLYMQRTADGTSIVLHELPSPSRRLRGRKWAIPPLESPFVDFTYDGAQDLLISVEKEMTITKLHVLSASTGRVHPKASKPFVTVNHTERGYDDSDIRVYAGLLAFITAEANFYYQDFYVWDWREGCLLLHLYHQDLTWPQPKVYFTIWDEKRVIIPIPDPLADGAQLAIFNCYERRGLHASFSGALSSAEYTLNLPRLGPNMYYDLIDICRDTSTMHPSHRRLPPTLAASSPESSPEPTPACTHVAFCPDHRARLFAITLYLEDAVAGRTLEHRLMVPWATLDEHLRGRPRVVPWKGWAHGTRLFSCPAAPEAQPLIFGACAGRYAAAEARADGRCVAVVYDFPSAEALRMDRACADAGERAEYVLEPTVVEEGQSKVWAEGFETAVPYRRIVSDILLEDDEYLMISEDCLLIHSKDERKPIRVISF